jgi:hypothetical protein
LFVSWLTPLLVFKVDCPLQLHSACAQFLDQYSSPRSSLCLQLLNS